MPQAGWAAFLVLGVVLAGCAGTKAGSPAASQVATATTGILRGIVVDEAIRPLGGANITATAAGSIWNATSAADGTFRIGGLDPGAYVVTVAKRYYGMHQLVVDVRAGIDEPEVAKFQLTFEARSVPFASVFKSEGFHECGTNIIRVCSNINIATWIVICTDTNHLVCLGNVTSDRSLFLVPLDGAPTFIQAEMAWEPTLDAGRAMSLLIGGANTTELQKGLAYAYNGTEGYSPLMLRLSNHEAKDNWCQGNAEPCRTPDTLNYTGIGTTRSLLVQVDAGTTYPVPGPGCDNAGLCGGGVSAQQRFTMFITVFHGYEPPVDWLFTATGAPPPPPA